MFYLYLQSCIYLFPKKNCACKQFEIPAAAVIQSLCVALVQFYICDILISNRVKIKSYLSTFLALIGALAQLPIQCIFSELLR